MTTKNERRRQALAEFVLWAGECFPVEVRLVSTIKSANPVGLQNPFLTFVVPRALSKIVEHSCLRTVEAWELLSEELERQGMRKLGEKNRDFIHLKRIRNKLIAHRVPNALTGKVHHSWYDKKYGTFESVLGLISRVALKLATRICRLQKSGRLPQSHGIQRVPVEFNIDYLRRFLAVLKENDLY